MTDFNDFVFCIFSFNRYRYLKNLVDSIDEFFPGTNVVIFDDQSDQDDLLFLYKQLEKRQEYLIIKLGKTGVLSKHGGLYNHMNRALEYAWKHDFSYAFFIQDDMQFVQKIDLNVLCKFYFDKWPNALMVSPLFMQKIFLPQINSYITHRNGDYLFKNYGVADAGIIHLQRAKTVVLNFNVRGEKYNGNTYHELGYQLVLAQHPCLAWVPWAVTYKNSKKAGLFIYRKNALYIKPLSAKNRQKLLNNTALPYLEDYTRLNAWWIPKPYLHLISRPVQILMTYLKYWKHILFDK